MAAKRGRESELISFAGAKKAFVGDVAPGREYVEPKIYQQPQGLVDSSDVQQVGRDVCMSAALLCCFCCLCCIHPVSGEVHDLLVVL